MQYTLAILKPDCVERKLTGKIIDFIESHDFEVFRLRKLQLTKKEAQAFYSMHKGRDFYEPLIEFMTSGPCLPIILKKDNAVDAFREVLGATDLNKAADGTIRKLYAETIRRNVVHGSDSDENAKKEIAFFFPTMNILV